MKKIYILISILLLSSGFLLKAQDKFLTAVPTTASLIDELPVDKKIKPQLSGSSASSSQGTETIDKSFDDNMATLYHSSYTSTTLPVTLIYAFPAETNLDYLIYHPRTTGVNGIFKELEIHYKLRDAEAEVKYDDFNFNGSASSTTVRFDQTLENVEYIKFVVKSALSSESRNYVSCAEMEFYQRNPNGFDYTAIFTDASCSEIKEGITSEDINAIKVEFYKKLAEDIFYGDYDKEYRVQEYPAYVAPEVTAAQNKFSFYYGKRDNPTGIYARKGETIVVFAAESADNTYPTLFIQEPDQAVNGTSFALQPGLNKLEAPYDGLMYILYYTQTGEEQPLKINIVTGTVNGYFNIEKHTNADWPNLLANATFSYFDVKGKYSSLNFDTDAFRSYTNNKIEELVKAYDNLVYLEMDFAGLVKYNRMPDTRMHFQVMPNSYSTNFMHATNYYTGYNRESATQTYLLDVDKLTDTSYSSKWAGGNAWGPAHEVGHVNQVKPALKWQGMTEVTNNIMSQYVTLEWGLPSRLNDEVLDTYGNRYNKAIQTIIEAEKPHNDPDGDVFCKLVPFWQLKLYMHDVLGNDDFYKDVYETLRVNPNPTAQYGSTSDGMCQLAFTKVVCQAAQLDFTEFFENWGFFTPINLTVEDYGSSSFIVTQQAINTIKAEIAAMDLPKPTVPAGKKLYEITDRNKEEFKVN